MYIKRNIDQTYSSTWLYILIGISSVELETTRWTRNYFFTKKGKKRQTRTKFVCQVFNNVVFLISLNYMDCRQYSYVFLFNNYQNNVFITIIINRRNKKGIVTIVTRYHPSTRPSKYFSKYLQIWKRSITSKGWLIYLSQDLRIRFF